MADDAEIIAISNPSMPMIAPSPSTKLATLPSRMGSVLNCVSLRRPATAGPGAALSTITSRTSRSALRVAGPNTLLSVFAEGNEDRRLQRHAENTVKLPRGRAPRSTRRRLQVGGRDTESERRCRAQNCKRAVCAKI